MTSREHDDSANPIVAYSLWHQLWALECAYWADVDFNGGRHAHEYYTDDDAVFDMGLPGSRLQGADAVAEFYAGRRAAGPRTSLHVVSNFAVEASGDGSATARSIISLHGSDGAPPQASAVPILMTRAVTVYVARPGEGWAVQSRLNTPCFVDAKRFPLDRFQQIVSDLG